MQSGVNMEYPFAAVFARLKTWIDRYAGRHGALPSLDVLASSASPDNSLEDRLNWLVDVVQWIRRPGHKEEAAPGAIALQSGRLRRFLDVLDRNPQWKKPVAQTLRSIIRETRAVALFSETGLPRQSGLLIEATERVARQLLPPPPGSAELGILFDRLFPYSEDETWIANLDEATLRRFRALLEFDVSPDDKDWNTLSDELEDALFQLAAQLRVTGCSPAIRSRLKHQRIRELPFFKLGDALQSALASRAEKGEDAFKAELNYLQGLIDACHRAAGEVLEHLEKRGVSTEVVYHLAFIEASLDRFKSLLELTFNPERPLTHIAEFVATLVQQNQARESVVDLLRQNSQLLTRKLVERSGQVGEHYITRNPHEYWKMFRKAAGGGVIMAFTTWFKVIILGWLLPGLMQGLAASLNYASGFVAIQLTGSVLATKQPANTAPALAARMHHVRDPKQMESLVDEVVCLVRSQIVSIVGNLVLVVPAMLCIDFVVQQIKGAPILTPEKATHTIKSLSILGASPFFAAFTGVLLWASSLVGAWADNWIVCHHIGEALASDRRLIRVLGTSRTTKFALFWARNTAGLASNISFGFMLGLIPAFAIFAGLPLDIRHVTLSSSYLAASVATLGVHVLGTAPVLLAIGGIVSIGCLNLAVSFSLAMLVAIRARRMQSMERRAIYVAVIRRLVQRPLSFLFPTGGADATVTSELPPIRKVVYSEPTQGGR
jgi:site-specific recombinase